MNDLSGGIVVDREVTALTRGLPPDAPLAMPVQRLERRPGWLVALLASLRPGRRRAREA